MTGTARTNPTISDLAVRRGRATDLLDRLGRVDSRAATVVRIVAAARKSSPEDMLRRSRRPDTALGRQLAMYLTHVMLGLTLTRVGRLFGRDRTTVAHACGQIEDRRDDPTFDIMVEALEEEIRSGKWGGQGSREELRRAG